MRLFLLPVSSRRTLIYCERLREVPSAPGVKPPLTERVITKANETWLGWEKAKGGWQKTITVWGNSLLRRLPYEEYGLKSLPPGTDARLKDIDAGKLRLKCLYPASFVGTAKGQDEKSRIMGMLEKLATERQTLHWNRFLYCLVGMPISAPFMIVPIVPNLPFYYLVYRAYCHYRALYGGKTLQRLIQSNAIELTPSSRLDELYTAGLLQPDTTTLETVPAVTAQEVESTALDVQRRTQGDKEVILLKRWNGDLLGEEFKLPEMEMEIERAVEQVEKLLAAEGAQAKQDAQASLAKQADSKDEKQS